MYIISKTDIFDYMVQLSKIATLVKYSDIVVFFLLHLSTESIIVQYSPTLTILG